MPKPGVSNNVLGDLSTAAKARRDVVEETLASTWRAMQDMDELDLRLAQAMRRSSVVAPVLEPARERLAEIRARLDRLHTLAGESWQAGQRARWE